MIRGLIFSDIDGTFLDEAGAVPFPVAWLAAVAREWRVIFASSRTARQVAELQARLGWIDWGIAEDGSVLVSPAGDEEIIGVPREEIIASVRRAGAWERIAGLLRSTGAPRHASLLLPRMVAEDDAFADFRSLVLSVGLRCSAGGRWATLTGRSDKGLAAKRLAARMGMSGSAAIGNDVSDLPLLESVDCSFVVRNPAGHHPRLAALRGATLLESPGPEGWKEMIGALQQLRRFPTEVRCPHPDGPLQP